ncbi:MAG: nuclear transport factor 2 family protein [Acidobacteriota bacterium]
MKSLFRLAIWGMMLLLGGGIFSFAQSSSQVFATQTGEKAAKPKWDLTNPNVKVALQMFEAFNQHDWAKMASFYIEDAEFLDPSYGAEYVKKRREALIAKYSGMEKMSPDIRDEIVGVYAADDKVIVEFISSGSIKNGGKWSLPICSILTVKQGKIIKDATYYDNGK